MRTGRFRPHPGGRLFRPQPAADHPLNDQLRGWWLGDPEMTFASLDWAGGGFPVLDMSRFGNWLWNYNVDVTAVSTATLYSGGRAKPQTYGYFSNVSAPGLYRDDTTGYGQNAYLTTTSAVTISLWMYFLYPNTGSYQTLVLNGRGWPSNQGFTANYCLRRAAGTNLEGCVEFYFYNTAAGDWAIWRTNTQVLATNAWNHITLTHRYGDSASTKLWVYNGGSALPTESAGSWIYGNGSGTPYATPDGFWVGRLGRGGEQFDGYLSDVQVRHSYWKAADAFDFWDELARDYPNLKNRIDTRTWFLLDGGATTNNYSLSSNHGAFISSGQNIGLKRANTVEVSTGMFNITGQSIGLNFGRKAIADAGLFVENGQNAGLTPSGGILEAETGIYDLVGQDAGMNAGRLVETESGYFDIAGQSAGLTHDVPGAYTVQATTAGYTFYAPSVDLVFQHRLFSSNGQWKVNVKPFTSLVANRRLDAGTASFSVSGHDAGLNPARNITVQEGSFVLSGQSALLAKSLTYPVDSGVFALVGQSVSLYSARVVISGSGNFVLAGESVSFLKGRSLEAGVGIFALTGESVGLKAGASEDVFGEVFVLFDILGDVYVDVDVKGIDSTALDAGGVIQ